MCTRNLSCERLCCVFADAGLIKDASFHDPIWSAFGDTQDARFWVFNHRVLAESMRCSCKPTPLAVANLLYVRDAVAAR